MDNSDIVLLDILLKEKREKSPSSLNDSEHFEYFVSKEVLKDLDVANDELLAGIVGGGKDGGIDSLYTFANEALVLEDTEIDKLSLNRNYALDLYVIQAKTSDGYSEAALTKITSSLPVFINLGATPSPKLYSQSLLTQINIFRDLLSQTTPKFPKVRIHIIYATKGSTEKIHPNVRAKAEELRVTVEEKLSGSEIKVEFLGARELLDLARREPSYTIELPYVEQSALAASHVALVKIGEYAKALTDETGRLKRYVFESNVRDFQGNTRVNEEIKATLDSDADDPDFWWMNNGVTILCSRATATGKNFTLQDAQIVNGLQTSVAIHQRYLADEHRLHSDQRSLLVRIITVTDEDIRNKVIVATNSQTNLDPSAIRATDPLQRDIEQFFLDKHWFYDRRKNFYRNQDKPAEKIVTIPYLAQAILAIGFAEPDVARARPSSAIRDDDQYGRLFNRGISFDIFLWMAELQKRTDKIIRASEIESNQKSNLKFHLPMFLVTKKLGRAVRHPSELVTIKGNLIDDREITLTLKNLVDFADLYQAKLGAITLDKISKSREFVDFLLLQ